MSEVAIETVTTTEGLEALAPEWDGLVEAMPRPSPFLLHPWILAWWHHAEAQRWRLSIHVARRGGRLVGALPLAVHRRHGLRVAEFVGGHLSSLADLLLAPGEPERTAVALAERAARAPHDLLDVFGLPDGSRLAAALGPRRLRLVARAEAPVLSLEGGWESVYRRRTSSRRRSLHRRRRRQLADLGRAETVVARTPAEVGPALRDAVRLHAARRHGRLDGSGFSTPPGGFQQPALLALARRDRTRIVTLQLDGRPIAYHCYLAFADAMYVHSLAFDPAYGRWSPGVVTTLDAIAHAASEGLRRVEFLGGGERYKLELADGIAPMHQGIGLAHGLHGRVAVAANHGRIALRLHAKRSPVLRRVYTDGLAPVRRARARRAAENATREDAA